MSKDLRIVFLQKRPHKAGAQTCLGRLLAHMQARGLSSLLLTSEGGWLTEECERHGVRALVESFPRSTTLPAMLLGNASFVKRASESLASINFQPDIVHANDHPEGPLALKLARKCGAKSAMFLRSTWMTETDYFLHCCHKFDFLSAVGEELRERARKWDPSREIALIPDGLPSSEFDEAREKAAAFPERLLVIGSPVAYKGWSDFCGALHLLLRQMSRLPVQEVHFTGERPDPPDSDLGLKRFDGIKFEFVGRVEDFRGLVRNYDLIVNPSRGESFGVAALESLAAGIPLVSSRTGVIEKVLESDHMLFRPNSPADLARALKYLMLHWKDLDTGVAKAQENIRMKFDLDRSVEKLLSEYERLLQG